jgi:hypothetical protein
MASMQVNNPLYKLQLHYWFGDKSHTMDALVYNKCEREVLELTKALAKVCEVAIKMETEPSGKGGLKSWLALIPRYSKKTSAAKMKLVTALVGTVIVAQDQKIANELVKVWMEKLAEANDNADVVKEEARKKLLLLEQNGVVRKRRSNLYDLLRKYAKVKSFSVALTDEAKKPLTEEQLVEREAFKTFVLSSNAMAPQILENASIEIISPVLVSGKQKWKGMYKGTLISFVMKAEEFMTMVQSGKVEFKSGSTIECTLQIERKMTATGTEKITNYNIIAVNSYEEKGKPTEKIPPVEIKQPKQKASATPNPNNVSDRQLDLFG